MYLLKKKVANNTKNTSSYFIRRGFTLLELLVVVSVIGILTGLTIVSTSGARAKARDDRRKADMQTVALSLEMYYAQNKAYPTWAGSNDIGNGYIFNWSKLKDSVYPAYISSWPEDPVSGHYYSYVTDSAAKKYAVDAVLEREATADLTIVCGDVNDDKFWKSGIVKCGVGNNIQYHYRVSGK